MTIKMISRHMIAVTLLVSMSACGQAQRGIETVTASLASDPTLTPEEQALVDESGSIVTTSLVQGVAAGALLGCLAGLAIAENKLAGCAVGAGAGAIGGGLVGTTVGQGNLEAKRTIDNEDEKIADLNAEHQKLASFGKRLRARIKQQNAELGKMKTQLARKEIDAATYKQRYARISSFRTKVSSRLNSDLETRQNEHEKFQAAQKDGVNTARIRKPLSRNIKTLKSLASASAKIAPPAVKLEDI